MGRKMRKEHGDNFLQKYHSLMIASGKVTPSEFTLAKFKQDVIANGTARWAFLFVCLASFPVPDPDVIEACI